MMSHRKILIPSVITARARNPNTCPRHARKKMGIKRAEKTMNDGKKKPVRICFLLLNSRKFNDIRLIGITKKMIKGRKTDAPIVINLLLATECISSYTQRVDSVHESSHVFRFIKLHWPALQFTLAHIRTGAAL
jgi:hypothetical protein